MLWVCVLLLKRSVSALRSVEDRRRYVHGAFMLHILANTHLFMCTFVYVNQIRLFCHIIGGLKLFSEYFRTQYG